jgi:hypothetical protein
MVQIQVPLGFIPLAFISATAIVLGDFYSKISFRRSVWRVYNAGYLDTVFLRFKDKEMKRLRCLDSCKIVHYDEI